MKASEARLIAENKKRTDFREAFDKIMRDITHNSKFGYFEIRVLEKVSPDVEKELKRLGYTIERRETEYNFTEIFIKW